MRRVSSLDERGDLQKKWSISDPAFGARTVAGNISLAALPKSKKKFNVSHPPLFPTILFVDVVVDNLHLFLRVADVLINHLIKELRRQMPLTRPRSFQHLNALSSNMSITTRSLYQV